MADPVIIKKYSNRRLYDTEDSTYVTLEELAEKIRGGTNVRVVDAKTAEDLTQATLTQIIIEGRGLAKLLPVPLLSQLIRLENDALAEFFGRYVTSALEIYLQAKRGAQAISPFNPFAQIPFSASDALARLWMSSPFSRSHASTAATPSPPDDAEQDDIATLREEIESLKREVAANKKSSG